MKLYCDPTGDVFLAVLDIEALLFDESLLTFSQSLTIDEIADNFSLLREISRTRYQTDSSNLHRYYLQDGDLYERDDWQAQEIQPDQEDSQLPPLERPPEEES